MAANLGNSPLNDWFTKKGAYVMVDGQFGSTGKGLIAAVIAESVEHQPTVVTTNAAPNSGHTAFYGDTEIMTQQIPVASVWYNWAGRPVTTYLNAGAIIDEDTLNKEIVNYEIKEHDLLINPCAAIITLHDKEQDQKTLQHIAGTGKGVGVALSKKVLRDGGAVTASDVIAYDKYGRDTEINFSSFWDWNTDVVFVETAQGFSLGVNEPRFYPHTTSRECTVGQALSDARIPAQMLQKVLVTMRTYPIRVGNTQGSSGECYPDQQEITWEELGLPPELTTITKRKRRVFTWSWMQFEECVLTNMPDIIFLNFCNYLPFHKTKELVHEIQDRYEKLLGKEPDDILLGFGPNNSDVVSAMYTSSDHWPYKKSLDGVPF